jgi:hypothetical protein
MTDLNLTPEQKIAFKIQLQRTIDAENADAEKELEFQRLVGEKNRLKGTRAHRFIFAVLVIGVMNLVLSGFGLYSVDGIKNTVRKLSRKATVTNVRLKHLKKSLGNTFGRSKHLNVTPTVKRTHKACTYTLTTDTVTNRFNLRSNCPS